jgi:hypothetical protein
MQYSALMNEPSADNRKGSVPDIPNDGTGWRGGGLTTAMAGLGEGGGQIIRD